MGRGNAALLALLALMLTACNEVHLRGTAGTDMEMACEHKSYGMVVHLVLKAGDPFDVTLPLGTGCAIRYADGRVFEWGGTAEMHMLQPQ